MVVGWGRCGGAVAQTQVLRAGWRAVGREPAAWREKQTPSRDRQSHRSSAGPRFSHLSRPGIVKGTASAVSQGI